MRHVVAGATKGVDHGVAQPLPERFVLQLLVRRAEVEVGRLHSQVPLEGQPDEDAGADGHDGEQATADRDNHQGQGCLMVNLKKKYNIRYERSLIWETDGDKKERKKRKRECVRESVRERERVSKRQRARKKAREREREREKESKRKREINKK